MRILLNLSPEEAAALEAIAIRHGGRAFEDSSRWTPPERAAAIQWAVKGLVKALVARAEEATPAKDSAMPPAELAPRSTGLRVIGV